MIFVIDFDGTLAMEDTVDKLLEMHADPSWEKIEAEWLAGQISAQECMQNQVRLVQADRSTLESFVEGIDLDPHFTAFQDHVGRFAKIAVVSDGLDYTVNATLRREGLDDLPVFANKLHFVDQDRLDLSFPHRAPDCAGGNGVCKCAVARHLAAVHGGPVILVGDGKSDACLAAEADVVFAKSSLIRHCESEGIAHTPFENFDDVLRVVKTWNTADRLTAVA